jgi:hypothetical protein
MTRQIHRVWQQAVRAASALTVPTSDIGATDRAVEMTLQGSRLFLFVDASDASGRRAWPHSRTRTWCLRLASTWTALSGTERIRAAGAGAVVAGLTAALVGIASPLPAGGLAWALPAATAVLGLVTSIAAAPLARALADKRT